MTNEINNEDDFQLLVDEMFAEFMDGGFDFDSSMTFDEVFKQAFTAGIQMVLEDLEDEDEEEDESEE